MSSCNIQFFSELITTVIFWNISRGLYVDFDPEKVACGLYKERLSYTPTYEYWRTKRNAQCTIKPTSCLRSTTRRRHHHSNSARSVSSHVSITASRPIAAASLNPCIYAWAIFHHFQIIILATWNWKISRYTPDPINKNCLHKLLKGNSPRMCNVHYNWHIHVRTQGPSMRSAVDCVCNACSVHVVHGYSGPSITCHFRASWLDKFA